MKILMINKFLYPNGGSETYIFKIGEYLKSKGTEVQYFGMEHEGRIVGNHAQCYTSDMDFHSGKLQKLLYPFKILYSAEAKKKLLAVLKDMDPDVVHLNNFNFQLTPSIIYAVKKYEKKKGKKITIIYTAHDYQLICPNHMMLVPSTRELCSRCVKGSFFHCVKGKCIHNSGVKSILGSMEGYVYKWLGTYRYLDAIICPSFFMKTQLDNNPMFAGKTTALHNFIDKPPVLEAKPADGEEGYVIYFGRYSEEKGIRTLLQACRKLPHIPFVFAGSGPLEEEVNQLANIRNMGFQSGEALRLLIGKAQFAIIASEWYENCPFSVMEAQMYGTPVLGADIGGIPELILNQKTGILFQQGNALDLQDKIGELWDNKTLCREFSRNCETIRFDTVEEYCEKLFMIYQNRI